MSYSNSFLIEDGVLRKYTGAPGVTDLVIPEGVTRILSGALDALKPSLRSIVLPQGLTRLDAIFENFRLLESVRLPGSLRRIPDQCFYNCPALRHITIPEGVESIGENAFQRTPVPALQIPASVRSIGRYSFSAPETFAKETLVTIHPDNPWYHMKDGLPQIRPYHEEGGLRTVVPLADPIGRSETLHNAATHEKCHLKRIRYTPEQEEVFRSVCRQFRYLVETSEYSGNDDYNLESLEHETTSFREIALEDVVIQDGMVIGFHRGGQYLPLCHPGIRAKSDDRCDYITHYRYTRTVEYCSLCPAEAD